MLAASEQIETDQLDNFVMVGELALTGAVKTLDINLPIARFFSLNFSIPVVNSECGRDTGKAEDS